MAVSRVQKREVEPLSPRSANIQPKPRSNRSKDVQAMVDEEAKRIEAAKKAAKEKEYASVPPEWVVQPAMSPGSLPEKYRTGKLLGKGGFALAYEGEFRNRKSNMDHEVFALKVVRAKMSQRKMEDKFRTELQIHAKMRHPNIVEFHRAFTYMENTYVVLEMCPNGSVMDMVKKRRCLTLPEVRRLMVQLCGAIKYMHARNVIHRDLKMGNLFLDHDMNLKIGDFGLAAVLVSKDEIEGMTDYAKSRRTTLCGTPNYIAPEILEKGKGGHDYKVDIWALGVILFAMIAGQPPFQSSSQNEIYKRARNVDYSWPEENKCHNDIPEEAKDLVSRLLKVDADKRPDPDHIVGHSFFSMHGGDAIPAKMEASFKTEKPNYLDGNSKPRGDVMLKGTDRLSIRTLAKQCGVGYLPGYLSPLPTVGVDIDLSLYKECAAEEAAGLGPVVPMPRDKVYVSRYSFDMPRAGYSSSEETRPTSLEKAQKVESIPVKARLEPTRRANVPSHAATLRAAPFNSKPVYSRLDPQLLDIDNINPEQKASTVRAGRPRRGLLNELPVRPTSNAHAISGSVGSVSGKGFALPSNPGSTAERAATVTRSKKPIVAEELPPKKDEKPKTRRARTKDEYIDITSPDPDKKRRQLAARTRARIASNVQKELQEEAEKPRKVSFQAEPEAVATITTPPHPQYFLSPDEVVETLPTTRPDAVLGSLRSFQRNLAASLQTFHRNYKQHDMPTIEAGKKSLKQRPVLVKWVDYTHKFGISYTLNNGTVGCLFKGEGNTLNPTYVVVPGAEPHLKQRRTNPSYRERHQMVPRKGAAVEFIENCGDEGLKRVCISPTVFQVKLGDKLGPGKDLWEYEKRRKMCLWDKFGQYMMQSLQPGSASLSDDSDNDSNDAVASARSNEEEDSPAKNTALNNAGPFIRFYQRLDNVGVWGFASGGLQFNFPDHTKIFIDAAGSWVDFYHLPLAAAQALKSAGRPLDAADLADRDVLSFPVDVLLMGEYLAKLNAKGNNDAGDAEQQGDAEEIIERLGLETQARDTLLANEFERKIRFVGRVVAVWVKEGGLGCMGARKGLSWDGNQVKRTAKRVWDTVGAKGGDERYERPL